MHLLGPPSAKHPRKKQLTRQGCECATACVTGHPNPRERLSRTHNAKEELHDTIDQMKQGPGNDPEAFETRQASGKQRSTEICKRCWERRGQEQRPHSGSARRHPQPCLDESRRGAGVARGDPFSGSLHPCRGRVCVGGTPVLGVREIHAAREGLAGAQPASVRRSGTESCSEICRSSLTFRGA